ncbi:hypothetical protein [Tomitella biformata]|uniref:hypothetical protein n=1 Tax=Tomitella biformata TaxID=630403 RepID=UPI0011DDDFDA|nr:hypothetical protein [Tomitella biformata]
MTQNIWFRRAVAGVGASVLAASLGVGLGAGVASADEASASGTFDTNVAGMKIDWSRSVSDDAPKVGEVVTITNTLTNSGTKTLHGLKWMEDHHPTCLVPLPESVELTVISSGKDKTYFNDGGSGPQLEAGEYTADYRNDGVTQVSRIDGLNDWQLTNGSTKSYSATWSTDYRVDCAVQPALATGGLTWNSTAGGNAGVLTSAGPTIAVLAKDSDPNPGDGGNDGGGNGSGGNLPGDSSGGTGSLGSLDLFGSLGLK